MLPIYEHALGDIYLQVSQMVFISGLNQVETSNTRVFITQLISFNYWDLINNSLVNN